MGLETFTYVDSLNTSNPTSSDPKSEGDDHLRGIKTAVKNTFPNVTGAVNPTHTELNYVDGVTSAIQTQIDSKQASDADLTTLATNGIGTSANQIVQLDGSAQLPAVSGALLTNLPAAGGTITAVASGALANGDTVILKSDGKVEVVASTSYSESIPTGSETQFHNGMFNYFSSASDPLDSTKFVLAFQNTVAGSNQYYMGVLVGTVSGTTLTFGTTYYLSEYNAKTPSVAYDPNTSGKIIIAYRGDAAPNADDVRVLAATVSGSTLSFGSVYSPTGTTNGYDPKVAFDPNTTGSFAIAFRDENHYGTVVAGTISGTTLTFGTATDFTTYAVNYYLNYPYNTQTIAIQFDPNNVGKFAVAYSKASNGYGYSIIGTVSGTTVTYGSETAFNSAACGNLSLSMIKKKDSDFAICYQDTSRLSHTRIINSSATSIDTVASAVATATTGSHSRSPEMVFDENSYKCIIYYINGSDSVIVVGEVSSSSNTLTFGTPVNIDTANNEDAHALNFLGGLEEFGKFFIAYRDGTSNDGQCRLGQIATTYNNLTADNFIGIADAAYADTATATIQVVGATDDAQSGLTVGSKHYVQNDGSLSTTAASPSVYAGLALSATSLLIKG